MAEWLYEGGIGEERAALVENGEIIEARIERVGFALKQGAVVSARLKRKAGPNGRGEVEADGHGPALLTPVPPTVTEGSTLLVEVIREAIPEPGNPKLPLVRASEAPAKTAPSLLVQLEATGTAVRILRAHEPDALEAAGWSEMIEQARSGLVPFPGGLLRIALTPAMTVIDVDGELKAAELARRGAAASGAAIRRFGIGGSIGIDLPSTGSKADRQAAAEALDATLPQPFERTAVNGFGFLQVVRRRIRPSLLELVQSDPITAHALALLRTLERGGSGAAIITAPRAVCERLQAGPEWLDELARHRGGPVTLAPDGGAQSV